MIDQLFRQLSSLPQVEAIALGGSRATSHFDEKSDYDIYLYCTAPLSEGQRRAVLDKYCSYVEYSNHYWELEDNGTFQNGIDFDLLLRNLDDFVNSVAMVVEHFQPSNAYTTCLWHNLITCQVIYDRNGRLTAAKQRFSVPYPPQLRQNIITRGYRLLCDSMPAYTQQIAKAISRGDLISINHRTTAFLETYFDVLFALNNQTHPGEKRLIELCLQSCTTLPEDFEANLKTLLSNLYSNPHQIPPILEQMIHNLEKILNF